MKPRPNYTELASATSVASLNTDFLLGQPRAFADSLTRRPLPKVTRDEVQSILDVISEKLSETNDLQRKAEKIDQERETTRGELTVRVSLLTAQLNEAKQDLDEANLIPTVAEESRLNTIGMESLISQAANALYNLVQQRLSEEQGGGYHELPQGLRDIVDFRMRKMNLRPFINNFQQLFRVDPEKATEDLVNQAIDRVIEAGNTIADILQKQTE